MGRIGVKVLGAFVVLLFLLALIGIGYVVEMHTFRASVGGKVTDAHGDPIAGAKVAPETLVALLVQVQDALEVAVRAKHVSPARKSLTQIPIVEDLAVPDQDQALVFIEQGLGRMSHVDDGQSSRSQSHPGMAPGTVDDPPMLNRLEHPTHGGFVIGRPAGTADAAYSTHNAPFPVNRLKRAGVPRDRTMLPAGILPTETTDLKGKATQSAESSLPRPGRSEKRPERHGRGRTGLHRRFLESSLTASPEASLQGRGDSQASGATAFAYRERRVRRPASTPHRRGLR